MKAVSVLEHFSDHGSIHQKMKKNTTSVRSYPNSAGDGLRYIVQPCPLFTTPAFSSPSLLSFRAFSLPSLPDPFFSLSSLVRPVARIARWALYLQEFNYTIEHRTGSKMAHVDALSRPPHCMLIQNSVHLQFLKAQQADDQITTIKTLLETTPHDNYIVKQTSLQNSQWHRFTSGT
ncbi:transposon Ty3-I Gag-Pol polyprotein [Trichonephila clavipes]|nr:transposon Ty3-I Gag-Pol polyprotein [Trichonephila clavipes]